MAFILHQQPLARLFSSREVATHNKSPSSQGAAIRIFPEPLLTTPGNPYAVLVANIIHLTQVKQARVYPVNELFSAETVSCGKCS